MNGNQYHDRHYLAFLQAKTAIVTALDLITTIVHSAPGLDRTESTPMCVELQMILSQMRKNLELLEQQLEPFLWDQEARALADTTERLATVVEKLTRQSTGQTR